MGWTGFPLSNQDTQDFEFLIQFWEAVRERYRALGTLRWPRHSETWETRTVTSVVANADPEDSYTLTSSGADWTGGDNPWNPAATGEIPYAPTTWRVVIEWSTDDYRHFVVSDVVSWTADTLKIKTITDYLTAKEVGSLADLAGKTFHIFRDHGYGLWWQQRWPEYPQATEHHVGTVSDATTTTLTQDGQKWKTDQWAGFEIVTTSDGFQRRAIITANTATTLSHAVTTWTPEEGTAFSVIEAGAVYRIGRPKWLPFAWYRGAMQGVYGHHPDDSLAAVYLPKSEISIDVGPDPCEPESFTVFDADFWSAYDELCSAADKPYGPNLFKSFRQLQVELETLSTSFIEKKDWDGSNWIGNFVPATWLKAAGINSQTGETTTNVTTGVIGITGITLPTHPLPITAYYAIIDPDVGILLSGVTSLDESMVINHGLEPGDGADALEGKELVISFGWSRFLPREFRYFHPTQFFIPDVSPEDGAVDPAAVIDYEESSCFGVGLWSKRAASTKYVEQTTGAPAEYEDFVTGELARWVGDNWHDGVTPLDGTEDGEAALTAYYDHPNVSTHQPETEAALRSGVATGGSAFRLQDDTKDWFATWYGGGVGHIESGTATSGTTTSLADTSKHDDDETGCFFNPERFPLFDSAYEDFILEVELPTEVPAEGGGTTIEPRWHKRVITATTIDATKVEISWAEALPSTANGRNWRIREPKYQLSRWQQRRCEIVQTVVEEVEGEDVETVQAFDVVITHSDDSALFFDEAEFEVVAGATYRIIDPSVGGVWKWDGTTWVIPEGDDVARTGVSDPQPFHRQQKENLPTIVKRYGRMMKGDYVDRTGFYDELYNGINALVWTLHGAGWTGRADPETEEPNYMGTSSYRQPTEGEATSYNDVRWAGGGPWGLNPLTGLPYELLPAGPVELPFGSDWYTAPICIDVTSHAKLINESGDVFHEFGEAVQREVGHGIINDLPTLLSCATEWFNYAQISLPGYFDIPPDEGERDPNQITYNFDANGDDVLFRQWSSWTTTAAAATAGRITDVWGQLMTRPETPSFLTPTNTDVPSLDSEAHWSGYMIADQKLIAKWDVSGGMTYVGEP